jgi:hypothetical protein
MQAKIGIVIQRVWFGAVTIAFLLALFIGDHLVAQWATEQSGVGMELLRRGSVIPLMFLIMLGLGVAEMIRLLRAKDVRPFIIPSYVLTLGLVALPWLGPAGYLGTSIADLEGLYWQLLGVIVAILTIGTLCVLRNNPEGTIRDGGATLLTVMYLGFLGSFGLQLRCGSTSAQSHGVWVLLIAILITKSSDIGTWWAPLWAT